MAHRRGQTATEYVMMLSVIVCGIVAAAYIFIPGFTEGVETLGRDIKRILSGEGDPHNIVDGGNDDTICPYVFDPRTGRWHDPEADYLMVSFSDASGANCGN